MQVLNRIDSANVFLTTLIFLRFIFGFHPHGNAEVSRYGTWNLWHEEFMYAIHKVFDVKCSWLIDMSLNWDNIYSDGDNLLHATTSSQNALNFSCWSIEESKMTPSHANCEFSGKNETDRVTWRSTLPFRNPTDTDCCMRYWHCWGCKKKKNDICFVHVNFH